MQILTLAQVADILEAATIEHTADHGHAIVHAGTTEAGHRFVMVNNYTGESVISLSL